MRGCGREGTGTAGDVFTGPGGNVDSRLSPAAVRSPESMLIDSQAEDFRIKRLARNSKLRSGAGCTRDSAVGLLQGGLDQFSFAVGQRCRKLNRRAGSRSRLPLQPRFINREGPAIAEHDGAFN